MKRFVEDLEELVEEAKERRRVLYTGAHLQLVLMALNPGEETGEEVHPDHDQFFRIEKGKGVLVLEGDRIKLKSNDAAIVPAGAHHKVINTGDKPLKLFMIYAPPHDPVAPLGNRGESLPEDGAESVQGEKAK